MSETHDNRLKRMRMRSWRRGTKEMDMILGPFADEHLSGFDSAALDDYDALLNENDQDLLQWILGQAPTPPAFGNLVQVIRIFAENRITSKI